MNKLAFIEPGSRTFAPKPGSWLDKLVQSSASKVIFVADEYDPELLIGSIRKAGAQRLAVRFYDKPIKATSTAKNEPGQFMERFTNKVSSAVWDLRRRRHEARSKEVPRE